MPKTKYTATFSDGTVIKRASDRVYSHAWRVQYVADAPNDKCDAERRAFLERVCPTGELRTQSGFAGSEALAHKAADSVVAALNPAKRGKARRFTSETDRTFTQVSAEVVAVVTI